MSDNDDKVIRFPGAKNEDGDSSDRHDALPDLNELMGSLSGEQLKALQIVLQCPNVVVLGIQPAGDGADFFTAIHGDPDDLADAGPHLGGVIERAYRRQDLEWHD